MYLKNLEYLSNTEKKKKFSLQNITKKAILSFMLYFSNEAFWLFY